MRVRSGEMPGSSVAMLPVSVERPASKRGGASGQSATSSEACGVVSYACVSRTKEEPSLRRMGEGHGRRLGTWSGRS